MLVQTSFYLLLVILGDVVNGNKPGGTPQNEESIKKTTSRSQSYSKGQSSKASSYSSSSVKSITAVGCHEDKCDRNSTYKRCPNPCPETCQNPKGVTVCNKMCLAHGCECNSGYVVSENGKCVKLEDCPDYLRCNDRNATFKACPNPCPGTCAFPGRVPCTKACVKEGCECKAGFYLDDKGKCVALQDCPGAKTCSANETFVFCKVGCPTNNCPKDDNRGIIACSPPYPCGSGCSCKGDYLRNSDNRCVLYSDCPPINCTRPNEVYCARPPPCLFEDCTDVGKVNKCDKTYPNKPQCICKPGFYRNKDAICVPEKECYPQVCGYNEVFSKCKIICPPQSCDSIFTSYLCTETKCEAGCNCLNGCLRNKSEICVPSEECFPAPQCDVSPECRPTCANPKPNCGHLPTNVLENQDGCKCMKGYVLSETDGVCIKIEECPDQGCNGDPNSIITSCPWPSPSTCKSPDAGSNGKTCDQIGCQCKPGYILKKDNGTCILPDDCKCGNPCGPNGTFSECAFRCPNQNCPKDDSRVKVACKPGRPCPSGCNCKPYHLRNQDGECVLASDCTQVECTRDNEVWNPCASECLAENCDDLTATSDCFPDPQNCQPQCVCCDGYYRNKSGACVPKDECPPQCDVSPECRPTCANPKPNCGHLPTNVLENQDGCKCMKGYVLSETDGVCIKIEECPDQGCNGDPNSTITSCPWPSPSTCKSPDAGSNGKTCDQIGCQCKPGYILKKDNGTCILPDDCKCGNPCGPNGTFSECAFRCPNQNCPKDDSRIKVACKPGRPCPSGCNCKPYHLRNKDGDCVLASDCTPVECTRDNEVWNPCASECLAENCDDLIATSDCFPDPQNCQPQCVCCDGYYRDKSGACVPKDECPINCEVKQECRPTCAVPNPPNCSYIPPSNTNVDKCNCQTGYVLSEVGGKCIKIEECPTNQTCNGDPNAVVKKCPLPCPSTCDSPNATPCKRMCDPIGCECKPGYIKSKNGTCILPDKCEGGNPCGKNETFSSCRYQCPTNYCPKDDSRAIVVCETYPFSPCYSGCSCKLNYKRNSTDDPKCILASECTPRNCTRQNEVWNPCPSECGSEYCDAVDNPPPVCNTLVLNCNPKCVCKKGYFRNDNDICVSSKECRKLNKRKGVKTSC